MKVFTRYDYTEYHLKKYLQSYTSGRRPIKIRTVSRLLGAIKGKSVLDLGIGGGYFSRLCVKDGARTVSLDFADAVIQYHRKNNGKLTLVQADAQDLPFRDESFDVVLALDIIEHLYSPMGFLNDIYRVLKKDGRLVLITPNTGNVIEKALKGVARIPMFVLSKVTDRQIQKRDTAHCTHVKEFSAVELMGLLKESGFKIRTFNTYNEHVGYRMLDPFISWTFLNFLRPYKWRKAYFSLEKKGREQ